jgi:hypothetical protein
MVCLFWTEWLVSGREEAVAAASRDRPTRQDRHMFRIIFRPEKRKMFSAFREGHGWERGTRDRFEKGEVKIRKEERG